MNPTLNDIPEARRTKLIQLLNAQLASCADLFSQIKQAHWNVKGPSFIALHELFDQAAEQVEEYVDEIAERAVQLGGTAMGTVRMAAGASALPEYPAGITVGADHVRALSKALAVFGAAARKSIEASDELGDKDTADLFTEVSRGIDKYLWFVEAHAQA
jgi:starvation-inducible DNA-binding protein